MKKSFSVFTGFLLLITTLCGCGSSGEVSAAVYSQEFETDTESYTLSVPQSDCFSYSVNFYEAPTADSDGSPDWGIFAVLPDSDGYLYLYQSVSPGGIEVLDSDDVQTLQLDEREISYQSADGIVSGEWHDATDAGFGIVFSFSEEEWEMYQEDIQMFLKDAEKI